MLIDRGVECHQRPVATIEACSTSMRLEDISNRQVSFLGHWDAGRNRFTARRTRIGTPGTLAYEHEIVSSDARLPSGES